MVRYGRSSSFKVIIIIIIIIIIWKFVSAPITVKNIGAWQCTCGKKGYAKLRENKSVLSSRLKTERDDSCLVCCGSWSKLVPIETHCVTSCRSSTVTVSIFYCFRDTTAKTGLPGRAAALPSPLIAVPNVTTYPSTASDFTNFILFDVALLLHASIKGLKKVKVTTEWATKQKSCYERILSSHADSSYLQSNWSIILAGSSSLNITDAVRVQFSFTARRTVGYRDTLFQSVPQTCLIHHCLLDAWSRAVFKSVHLRLFTKRQGLNHRVQWQYHPQTSCQRPGSPLGNLAAETVTFGLLTSIKSL